MSVFTNGELLWIIANAPLVIFFFAMIPPWAIAVQHIQLDVFRFPAANGTYVRQLKKSTGSFGGGALLKVMSGDAINTSVDYYYNVTSASNSTANGLNTLVSSLLAAITGSPAVNAAAKAGASSATTSMGAAGSTMDVFLNGEDPSSTANQPPAAYLHVLLFNEQFVFDNVNSYVERVATASQVKNVSRSVAVKKNGYAYIYFSNESESLVWFDNFQLAHQRGAILEETHYYPFGLAMAGISSSAAGSLENMRKYNKGSELQHEEFSDGSGLELYATQFRGLDPQLGRWWQIDPKPDYALSPYSSMGNNPISFNDPLGDTLKVEGNFYQRLKLNVRIGIATIFSKHAREMVRDIKKADFTIKVHIGPKGSTSSDIAFNSIADAGKKGSVYNDVLGGEPVIGTGKGSNSEITLSRITHKPKDMDGNNSGSKKVTLLHELFHGWQAGYGKLDHTMVDGVRNSERDAVDWENVFRSELGGTSRYEYHSVTNEMRNLYHADFKERAQKSDPRNDE